MVYSFPGPRPDGNRIGTVPPAGTGPDSPRGNFNPLGERSLAAPIDAWGQACARSRVIQFPARAPPKVMHSAAPAVPSVGSGLAAWRSSKGGPIRLVQTGVFVGEVPKGGNCRCRKAR